ncbi:MBL fold metallo-hydrolase [Tenacibaculum sp. TC6]|uniref:MBL fold metallo-hydrolase n=1 Tax=Tenacibaculum sp. TC6 TaxID=3423223 RepID=UPI003D369FF5
MKSKWYIFILTTLFFWGCHSKQEVVEIPNQPFFVVLGVAQDAGYPQIACTKQCCTATYKNPTLKRMVSCIGLVDPINNESWMFDATPDFTKQAKLLTNYVKEKEVPDGIFLTHGHIGHYTGIMYLGREAMSAAKVPVYAMPRMREYLTNNGPWSQLVSTKNIALQPIQNDTTLMLNQRIAVTPLQVPHRDEYTETVGYMIHYGKKKALFIPDIDKWQKWERSIVEYIKEVDIAFLDATFFKNGEINRDMSEVPHPFVEESMQLFENLTPEDKKKIYFIHFNHTNPLLEEGSEAQKQVQAKGFRIAKEKSVIPF